MSQWNIDSRGDRRVGIKMRETSELQVRLLRENAVLPVRGSARATGYDLCAASNCIIPSRGKGTVDTGLAVSLPPGVYARIAPCSGLAIKNFIDVGAGVVDSDYRGEVKVILSNHSVEDFPVQAGDRIAQLILERIETPQVKKVAALDDTDHGTGGFGSTGTKQLTQSSQAKDKKGTKKRILYPHHQVHDRSKCKTRLTWWSAWSRGFLLRVGWPGDLPMDKR